LKVIECKEESLFQSEEIAKFLQEFGPSIKTVDSQINLLLNYIKLNRDNSTVKGDILSLILILKSFEANLVNEWRLKPSSKINFKIPLAAGSKFDINQCMQQASSKILTNSEVILHAYIAHYLKTNVIREAAVYLPDLSPVSRIRIGKFVSKSGRQPEPRNISSKQSINDNSPYRNRQKRWVWTDFVSTVSGLAKIDDVKRLNDNQESIRRAQINNENEILLVEKTENTLLKEMQDNSDKLTQLFKDESEVSDRLLHVNHYIYIIVVLMKY
jgi:hypothetical protein